MADKEKDKERNYVAEAQNWEARVKGELDSARCWEANWGELLYNDGPGEGSTQDRIANLEAQIKKLPVTGAMTTHQLSYTLKNCTPYEESKHRRKTAAMQQSSFEDGLEDVDESGGNGAADGGLRRPEP